MADTYIDYDEMEIYGQHTIAALTGLEPLHVGISSLREQLKERGNTVQSTRQLKRGTGDGSGAKRGERDDLRVRLIKSLRSLKSHLDSVNNDEDADDIDPGLFFLGGALGDLANASPAQILLKADFALVGFEKSPDFSLKKEKHEKLAQMAKLLRESLKETSAARPEEANASTALQSAGEEWRRFYRGLKWIVWGLLIQHKREKEFSSYFKDETVGSAPSSTPSAPTEPPAPSTPA